MFPNNSIIITNNKIDLLKKLNKQLLNIKIYNINEFNKLYYFDYNKKTIYYVMNKYNVNYEIAKIYINNLYFIDDKVYKNNKLRFLKELKEELIKEKLLKVNHLFKDKIKNKEIIFYNIPLSKEVQRTINSLNKTSIVKINNESSTSYKHIIYSFNNIEDEVVFIANQICSLIKQGTDIKHIFLSNLNDEYRKLIKRIFPMFNLHYSLDDKKSIYSTLICTKFFEYFESDIETTINKLKELVNTKESEDIFNKIINVVNEYSFEPDKLKVKDMIKSDLKNTYLSKEQLENSVHEVSLKESFFQEEDHIFLLSFNQGIIPTIYKDENYLTDKDKKELNISYTVDKNILENEIISSKISSIKNLTITYKKNANGEEFYLSNLNDSLNYEIVEVNNVISDSSNTYNKLKLSILLDDFIKYGTKSNMLFTLNSMYKELPYKTYNNSFSQIEKESLIKYLDNKILLSYSSLDKYYKCPFSYYIGNILKLDIYEETFYQVIGTIFHSILEKFNSSSLSFDELWNEEIKNIYYSFNNKEIFFLNKLKKELAFIIGVIKEQENYTNLHDELHEEKVYTSISGDIKITFTGIIDKIKYKKDGDKTIVAIIDYKTGNPNIDLTTVPYGIGMQLPIYLYLASNSKKLENIKVAGFYLQKILNNEIAVDNSHSYEQLKKKNLLLQGYSNTDTSILSEFDNSYEDSMMIKSMKVKKDSSFSSYAKVLSDKEINSLIKLAEDKIVEGANEIVNGNFSISPKKIGKINHGCTFCKFRDICYHTAKDTVELKELSKEDVFGGDENGMD